jgi:tetratricopeptide (TPR) repeat protein
MYAPDLKKSALGDAAAKRDTVTTVNEILRRLRRVKPVRDPERFNLEQPVLEDFYRRQTTPRRLHLLLSMALQYHDIPHRLVAGKILRFETVLENQLWLEVFAGGRWSRIHMVEEDNEYVSDNEVYVSCSYDFRDFTFEVFGSGQVDWDSRYRETLLDFWDKKDTALVEKDYELAIGYLDSMLYYAPKMLVAVAEKGLVIIEAGRPVEGMKYLQFAINNAKTDADRATAYLQLGKYYSMTGNKQEAVKALTRAGRLANLSIQAIYNDHRFKTLREDPQVMRQLELLYFQ